MKTTHAICFPLLLSLSTRFASAGNDTSNSTSFHELDFSKLPSDVQKMFTAYPNGAYKPMNYTKPPPTTNSTSNIASISFYEASNCAGSGADEEITIFRKDFDGATLCPSGDGNGDDIESNGSGFIINGDLGNCQLHWYSQLKCNASDHLGFMTGETQLKGCMHPLDDYGNPIFDGFRAFQFSCPQI